MRPLRANGDELGKNELVLFRGPLAPYDIRIDHVVPALAALPSEAIGQKPRNNDPVLRTKLLDFLA